MKGIIIKNTFTLGHSKHWARHLDKVNWQKFKISGRQMGRGIDGQMGRGIDGQRDRWVEGQMGRWINGQMDKWIDG